MRFDDNFRSKSASQSCTLSSHGSRERGVVRTVKKFLLLAAIVAAAALLGAGWHWHNGPHGSQPVAGWAWDGAADADSGV
jgi:hypothetical protein